MSPSSRMPDRSARCQTDGELLEVFRRAQVLRRVGGTASWGAPRGRKRSLASHIGSRFKHMHAPGRQIQPLSHGSKRRSKGPDRRALRAPFINRPQCRVVRLPKAMPHTMQPLELQGITPETRINLDHILLFLHLIRTRTRPLRLRLRIEFNTDLKHLKHLKQASLGLPPCPVTGKTATIHRGNHLQSQRHPCLWRKRRLPCEMLWKMS